MEAKNSRRGGSRPGAGRLPNPSPRKKVTVALTPEQMAFAEAVAKDRSLKLAQAVGAIVDAALFHRENMDWRTTRGK